jgi:hypothetical protein
VVPAPSDHVARADRRRRGGPVNGGDRRRRWQLPPRRRAHRPWLRGHHRARRVTNGPRAGPPPCRRPTGRDLAADRSAHVDPGAAMGVVARPGRLPLPHPNPGPSHLPRPPGARSHPGRCVHHRDVRPERPPTTAPDSPSAATTRHHSPTPSARPSPPPRSRCRATRPTRPRQARHSRSPGSSAPSRVDDPQGTPPLALG